MKKTLIVLGLLGIISLLALSMACGGSSDDGDGDGTGDGNGGGDAAPTATSAPRPTNTPAPASRLEGVPEPSEFTGGDEVAATALNAEMLAVGADGISGTLDLIQIDRSTKLTLAFEDAGPGPYSAAIRRGDCPEEGAEAEGQFDYLLFDVEDGGSVSMVNTPAQFFQFSRAYVVVVGGTDLTSDPLISCGNIPSPQR